MRREAILPGTVSAAARSAIWRRLAAGGGLFAAFASMSCCILPLTLFGLGIGGAWLSNLTALTPYQPIFVGTALAFLGAGYWFVYRRPRAVVCAADGSCRRGDRGVKLALWLATVIVAASLAFPYVAPSLLGT